MSGAGKNPLVGVRASIYERRGKDETFLDLPFRIVPDDSLPPGVALMIAGPLRMTPSVLSVDGERATVTIPQIEHEDIRRHVCMVKGLAP